MMEVGAAQRLDWDQYWDFHPQDSHPIGVEDLVFSLKNVKLSHTHNTSHRIQNSQREVNYWTHNQNQCSVPPKVPSLLALGLDEVKYKTRTQQQTQLIEITKMLLINKFNWNQLRLLI